MQLNQEEKKAEEVTGTYFFYHFPICFHTLPVLKKDKDSVQAEKEEKKKGKVYFCKVRLNFHSGKAGWDDVIPPPAFHQLDTLNVYH